MITGQKLKRSALLITLLFLSVTLGACSQGKDEQIAAEKSSVSTCDENSSISASDDASVENTADESENDNDADSKQEWEKNVLTNDTDEIKAVVYNYETNKNLSVKNGGKVPFSEGDMLAFLVPGDDNSLKRMSSLFSESYSRETKEDDGTVSGWIHYFTDPSCDEETFLFHVFFTVPGESVNYYITLDFRDGADEKAEELGLDSTLPGLEWIATLDDVVTQPTVIVYNDSTNKKIIVEDGDEILFDDPDDVFAYYSPNADEYPSTEWEPSFFEQNASHIAYSFEKSWVGSDELPDASSSPRKIWCYQTIITDESPHDDMTEGCLHGFSVGVEDSNTIESIPEFYLYTPY